MIAAPSDRTDEMARHLFRVAGELHRAGKIDKARFPQQLNEALLARWPDAQVREVEAAAIKFIELADSMTSLVRPANTN